MLEHLLAAMTPENREIMRLGMDYGMRVGDIVAIPYDAPDRTRYAYREEKTGKRRVVKFSERHKETLKSFRYGDYCFPHRTDPTKHRTRQAVWADLRRISKAFRLAHVSPHSARKLYAVEFYRRCGSLERVAARLNHSDPAVTALYALADQLTIQNRPPKKKGKA